MTTRPRKKLAKAERRQQLLDTAMRLVADEGVDALKLGALAERAGVSKPVVYEHFATRSGLLIALYRAIDARQVRALEQVLERTPRRLLEVARAMSIGYMNCCLTVGSEWYEIKAALQGDEQMIAVQQELLDNYVALHERVLAPFTKITAEVLHLHCVGVIGAAEALALEMLRGRTDAETAAYALMVLMTRPLKKA